MEIKVGSDNINDIKNILEEIGISFSPRKKDKFAIIMLEDDIEQHAEEIKEIIKKHYCLILNFQHLFIQTLW